jgi:hypothetical protein
MNVNNYRSSFEIPKEFDASNYETIKNKLHNNGNFKLHNLEDKNNYWWAILKSKIIFSTSILIVFIIGGIYIGGKGFVPVIGFSALFFLYTYISLLNHLGFYKEQNLYYTTELV